METTTQKQNYWQKLFNKKMLIQKGIIAAIAIAIVVAFSLSFYLWLRNTPENTQIGKNPFWYITITWNDGFGFGGLSGKTGAIYAIQSLMYVLLIAVFLLVCQDKITSSFIALAMFGGLFNLIQRAAETGATKGCVLDYFSWGFWPSFPIFNWPDMFVVIGIFGFIISYIITSIIRSNREERAEKIAKYKKEQQEANGQH